MEMRVDDFKNKCIMAYHYTFVFEVVELVC